MNAANKDGLVFSPKTFRCVWVCDCVGLRQGIPKKAIFYGKYGQ